MKISDNPPFKNDPLILSTPPFLWEQPETFPFWWPTSTDITLKNKNYLPPRVFVISSKALWFEFQIFVSVTNTQTNNPEIFNHILSQCYFSIPAGNIRKFGFLMFLVHTDMEYLLEMVPFVCSQRFF